MNFEITKKKEKRMTRKSKGRQKIEMTRMSKESNLLVTFSKRRSGLFKKAYELHTLCGAEIAIIVFSPGKKVFSYAHPCLYSIIDRFVTGKGACGGGGCGGPSSSGSSSSQLVEAHRAASIRELNMQLTEMLNQSEAERKRGEELVKLRKASQGRCWWEASVDELGLQELDQLKAAMEALKKSVAKQAEKLMMVEAASSSANTTAFLGGAASGSKDPAAAGGLGLGIGGHVGGPSSNVGHGRIDNKVVSAHHDPLPAAAAAGLGLSMTPHGFTVGYGRGFFLNPALL